MNAFKADLMMLFVTIFWGSSYLFMKIGLDTLSEFNLIALRFGLAFLLAAALFHRRLQLVDRETLKFSILLGFILFLVFTTITYGLKTTTTSNAGFLVSLTVIFVPLLNSFVFKSKIDPKLMLSILLALTGIAFLTIQLPFRFVQGDLLCIMTAFFYALHIIVVERAAQKVDSLNLGIIQLGVVGLLGFVFSLIFETPVLPSTTEGWVSILMLSILCSAIGFIFQTVAQKYTSSTRTGLIFSLEPVFAALFGFLFIQEMMSGKEIFGASLVLFSIVFTTIKWDKQIIIAKKRSIGS
ncbi:DMT family transporter [Bacillus sp. FJAT-29790]|uniref:DMT family transporter n=1 Tax=Bacillus sp. FJAT-29790 TaxID=1895002 RepID=UPI001C233ADC|nr:DMT family transporter [Bacillus sp. FJAT-29790]MBU8878475.1 DMT family transporter [Bacillus sp. FJAT-29790]